MREIATMPTKKKKKKGYRNTALIKPLTFEQLREIIPLINDSGLTTADLALIYGVHRVTIFRWINKLKDAGFTVNLQNKGGRPPLKI
jgi:transposase